MSADSMESVIGLEIHVQLRTEAKLFCADSTRFGDAPNSNVCPVCLGLPGALPVLNEEAVTLAARCAFALGCTVYEKSIFARKNYFYPDLPKGYQISQFEQPIALDGIFQVAMADGTTREIRIRRIHIEEDAGKSIHDRLPGATAVDLNRTGTPLIELVSEPDFRTPEEVRAYLQQIKQVIEYLDVSDCNMEEGSLRVDANVSIRPVGETALSTKTELKNMNSFSGVEKALGVEIRRQKEVVARGERVAHMTLLWDDAKGEVRPMRSKEESHDYRYFPDPDLPPLLLSKERMEEIRAALPELPAAKRARFVTTYQLSAYDAEVLTASSSVAAYYEALAAETGDPKQASNWVMGPVLALAKERGVDPKKFGDEFPLSPAALGGLIGLILGGTISQSVGKSVLLKMVETGRSAAEIVESEGLAQVSDAGQLEGWIDGVIAAFPDELARFRGGEKKLQGFFMGEIMKASKGKADPGEAARLLGRKLAG